MFRDVHNNPRRIRIAENVLGTEFDRVVQSGSRVDDYIRKWYYAEGPI